MASRNLGNLVDYFLTGIVRPIPSHSCFFKKSINSDTIKEEDKQYITIFTKNSKSRLVILKQLERMGISIQRLYEQSKFEFICTEGSDLQDKMIVFKERLEKNSQKNNPRYAVR